ncbi:MAG: 16S rRNA (cytosine(967)-C(5))-methyltransferase, partial [Pseudomonadales bacterium]
DIRLIRTEGAISALLGMQRVLLDALWDVIKEDGRLLYTTCSILPAENDDQIGRFLERHPNASLGALSPKIPGTRTAYGIQQFPSHTGGDGFYYALLVKSGSSQPRVRA